MSLRKRGPHLVGLCPFHTETTPSFHVDPDRGVYRCFGCKEIGDEFIFVERTRGYTFTQAMRVLAERTGVPTL